MIVKTISAPEAAYALRRALGTIRAWDDCLADMRRGRTDCHGYVLKPIAQVHDGRSKRPIYLASHVAEFIKAILEIRPGAAETRGIQTREMDVDMSGSSSWLVRPVSPVIH